VFGSSSALSGIYGVDIVCNEVLTSGLFLMVLRYNRKYSWWQCSFFLVFLFVDLSFFGAVMKKILEEGWVTLIIAFFFCSIMLTWYGGEYQLRRFRKVHDTSTRIELLQDRFIFDDPHHHHPPSIELSRESNPANFQENLKLKLKQKENEMEESKENQKKLEKEKKIANS